MPLKTPEVAPDSELDRKALEVQPGSEINRKTLKVQLVPHEERVSIWELGSSKQVFRMRTSARAELMPHGRNHVVDPRVQDAQQRQANNCGIALDVKERVRAA